MIQFIFSITLPTIFFLKNNCRHGVLKMGKWCNNLMFLKVVVQLLKSINVLGNYFSSADPFSEPDRNSKILDFIFNGKECIVT